MAKQVGLPDVAIRLMNRRLQMETVYRTLTMAQTTPQQDVDHLRAYIDKAVMILEEVQEW